MNEPMTTIVITLTVAAWIFFSAFFLVAACVLSARLWNASTTPEDSTKNSWALQDGEIPTTPVSSVR